MSTLWLVIQREFRARVSKRGYWVFTILGLLLMVGIVFLPNMMNWIQSKSLNTVAVHDPAGLVTQSLRQAEQEHSEALGVKFVFAKDSDLNGGSPDEVSKYLKQVGAKALLDVRGASPTNASFVLEQNSPLNPANVDAIHSVLQSQIMQERIQQLNPSQQQALLAPVSVTTQALQPDAKSSDEVIQSRMLVYVMDILLMVTLVLYGTWVAQGVIEEKSNRIVELLLVAAKPWQVLFGKVLGVGLVALLQYAIWITAGIVALTMGQTSGLLDFSSVSASTFAWFPIFFILGYLLYACLFGLAGALVYRAEEQQMAIMPVSLLMVVAFYAAMAVLFNPDSLFAVIISLVPFCAPLAMFARIATTTVPIWQLGLSLVLSIVFVIGAVRFGETIYRRYALRTSGASGWKLLMRRAPGGSRDL